MAWYRPSLLVLKVPLHTNQPTNRTSSTPLQYGTDDYRNQRSPLCHCTPQSLTSAARGRQHYAGCSDCQSSMLARNRQSDIFTSRMTLTFDLLDPKSLPCIRGYLGFIVYSNSVTVSSVFCLSRGKCIFPVSYRPTNGWYHHLRSDARIWMNGSI